MELSYSNVFVFLWASIFASCAYNLLPCNGEKKADYGFQNRSYLIFSLLLVLFAAFRPIGISRDDLNYLEMFKTICPSVYCGEWVQGSRDWGWFSLVGLLKSLWPDPRIMLLLSAFGLIVKLWVIYRVCRQPMMALLLYAGVFYQIFDLTQFRVSSASTVFFVSFYFLTRDNFLAGGLLTLFSGFFHKQAFISPLILIGKKFYMQHSILVLLSLLPICMMLFGFYPDIPKIMHKIYPVATSGYGFAQGIEMYLQLKVAGIYDGWRVAPITCYPLIAIALFLSKDVSATDHVIYRYISIGVLSAIWFLWGFASLPDVQIRFFEYMMMSVIFLVGICRFDIFRFGSVAIVSAIFVIKYNFVHSLISGSLTF